METLFEGMPIWLNFVLFVVGAVIITKAADCFVDAAVNISIATHIPKILMGVQSSAWLPPLPNFAYLLSLRFRERVMLPLAIASVRV